MTSTKKTKRGIAISLFAIICIGLLTYALLGLWQQYVATHHTDVSIPTKVVNHSTDQPEETDPADACENYEVGVSLPRKIVIESIGVDGCVQQVGLDQNGAIAVPTNIHLAGWYTNSSLPGEKGNSIIDGHVLGRYNDAIFVKLVDLKSDQTIKIEFGDRTWKSFRVVDTKSYSVKDAASALQKQLPSVERQLTLITCTGTFDVASQRYDQRVIIHAEYQE